RAGWRPAITSSKATPPRIGSPLGWPVHDAAHALDQQIVAGAMPVGAVLPEAGDRAIDVARVVFRQAGVVEPELGETSGLEILDHYVGAPGELVHDAAAVLGLEIGGDRPLAAIAGMV